MEFEPDIEEQRATEAVLLAIDTTFPCVESFTRLRDAAFRLARTRLIYPVGKDDLLGVLQAGSETTCNPLNDNVPEGYQGIHLHVPIITASIRTIRALTEVKHDACAANLLDVLDVSGDRLVSAASVRARVKRLLLFTSYKSVFSEQFPSSSSNSADNSMIEDEDEGKGEGGEGGEGGGGSEYELAVDEFIATCDLFRDQKIRVDIFVSCGKTIQEEVDNPVAKRIQEFDEEFDEEEESDEQNETLPPPRDCVKKASKYPCSKLLALSKCTGGFIYPLSTALPHCDNPIPKSKRPTSKFSGVLDIAGILQIPIKRYTYTTEVKGPAGKKLSWEESVRTGREIRILSETNRVSSVKADNILQPDEIINGYPYGPQIIPVTDDAWSLHKERGLNVIGFVKQDSIPMHKFISGVDVVIPMKDCKESNRLLKTIVLSLEAENMGILARSVMALRGGAPTVCYLWPRVEVDKVTKTVKNCFLFAVQIPMREDFRDLPFASLNDQLEDVPDSTMDAMDDFVTSSMLPSIDDVDDDDDDDDVDDDDDDDDEQYESGVRKLDPPEIGNPNLHWFNLCILHRIINGVSCTDFPTVPNWHEKLLKPSSFFQKRNNKKRDQAIRTLKSTLPMHPTQKRTKNALHIHTALNGDSATYGVFLPDNDAVREGDDNVDVDVNNRSEKEHENEKDVNSDIDNDSDNEEGEPKTHEFYTEGGGGGDDEEARYDRRLSNHLNCAEYEEAEKVTDDMISAVTDMQITDVSCENAVHDFYKIIEKTDFRYGAESLKIMINRLIRDATDDDRVIECLKVFRKESMIHKVPTLFNDFIASLATRCEAKNDERIGKRTRRFLKYVGSKGRDEVKKCLKVIQVKRVFKSEKGESCVDKDYNAFLKENWRKIDSLTGAQVGSSDNGNGSSDRGSFTVSDIRST